MKQPKPITEESLQELENALNISSEPSDLATSSDLKELRSGFVQTGQYLQTSVHYRDTDYVPTVREDLIKEYNANSMSEMLLVDMVANAYFSYMRASRALKSFIEDNDGRREYDSQPWINMLKELTKVTDMAQRHFTSALTVLKELKRPPIKVKVQAKEAFIGQNQQFNKNA